RVGFSHRDLVSGKSALAGAEETCVDAHLQLFRPFRAGPRGHLVRWLTPPANVGAALSGLWKTRRKALGMSRQGNSNLAMRQIPLWERGEGRARGDTAERKLCPPRRNRQSEGFRPIR